MQLSRSGAEIIPADHTVIDGQPYSRILVKDTAVRGIGYYQISISGRHQLPLCLKG